MIGPKSIGTILASDLCGGMHMRRDSFPRIWHRSALSAARMCMEGARGNRRPHSGAGSGPLWALDPLPYAVNAMRAQKTVATIDGNLCRPSSLGRQPPEERRMSEDPTVPDGTETDAVTRSSGYYWIDAAGDQIEIARWDADIQVWHLIGQIDPIPDIDVDVLSDVIEEPIE